MGPRARIWTELLPFLVCGQRQKIHVTASGVSPDEASPPETGFNSSSDNGCPTVSPAACSSTYTGAAPLFCFLESSIGLPPTLYMRSRGEELAGKVAFETDEFQCFSPACQLPRNSRRPHGWLSRPELPAGIHSPPPIQWCARPASDRWSIARIVDHVITVQGSTRSERRPKVLHCSRL